MHNRYSDYQTYALGRVQPLCLEAIATMRRFLDDAEREINRADTTPEDMIASVMKKAAWGWANASSDLQSAMSALADVRKVRDAEKAEQAEVNDAK